MADLLECLIQIKALRETLHRLTGLPTTATRAGSWEQLAETERRYAGALGRPSLASRTRLRPMTAREPTAIGS